MFAAVPVAYPGDRTPTLAKGVVKGKVKAGARKTVAASRKKAPAKKTASARTTGKRASGA